MREILFRGKRKDNGEWVFGDLRQYSETSKGIFDYKLRQMVRNIIPESISEFTGLTDKNGKKIFEGDIVEYNTYDDFDYQSIVKFGEYKQDGSSGEYRARNCIGFYVEVDNFTCPDWCDDDPSYFREHERQQNILEVAERCEVIGNRYDNPELIGAE